MQFFNWKEIKIKIIKSAGSTSTNQKKSFGSYSTDKIISKNWVTMVHVGFVM